WSYIFYLSYFRNVDSILKSENIQNIIVSNSDQLSMLNLDILITDTTANNWKDLNYLFHDYKISYTLTASSHLNQKKASNQLLSFGISLGDYKEDYNLRFSNKLA